MSDYKPFVPADVAMRDFNFKTVALGVILGAVFGSANAYLGLRVGLTISTAIPLAVVSVAIFRVLAPVLGRATILECNISQTTGSASSAVASGIIFTIPALFIWGHPPTLLQMTALAVCGGVLGILFMIPLRGFLIVKEHHNLPYPEGTASAEVLIAASEGGSTAKNVFLGLAVGAFYKALISLFYLWPSKVKLTLPLLPKAVIGVSTTPALIGVGYILGRRIATIMVAGGLISWVVLIPVIAWQYGDFELSPTTLEYLRSKGVSEDVTRIGGLTAKQIWEAYIRIIGAGAVAAAGIITVIRSLPTMFQSLKIGIREIRSSASELDKGKARTEQDLSLLYVLCGVSAVILVVTLVPGIIGFETSLIVRLVSALAIACFSFCFVTVASRIVGLIGVSSNPTSGMAIVTLLGTGLIFQLLGWTDLLGKMTALTVGTIVCISASMAGDISQDLKAGFLVGATPRKQQITEIIGAMGSAFFVCLAVYYLGMAYGFGTEEMPAPQATLMKTVLDGVLDGNLRWDLVGIGAGIAAAAMFFKMPPLPFAVGIYLPLYTMTPVFIGGLIRHLLSRRFSDAGAEEKGKDQGVLLGSGFIAGEGLMGVVIAIIAVATAATPKLFAIDWSPEWLGQLVSALAFAALGWFLYRVASTSRSS